MPTHGAWWLSVFLRQTKKSESHTKHRLLPGVDIKAHKNNYVVVAPTEIDGSHYQWLNHKPMAKPDEGLIELIEEKAQPVPDINLAAMSRLARLRRQSYLNRS